MLQTFRRATRAAVAHLGSTCRPRAIWRSSNPAPTSIHRRVRRCRAVQVADARAGPSHGSAETAFVPLIHKIVRDCLVLREPGSVAFRKALATDCHAALLFTPDATLYQVLADNGWDGLDFASQSFDAQFLAEDLQQLLSSKNYSSQPDTPLSTGSAQMHFVSKSPSFGKSPLSAGLHRAASQGSLATSPGSGHGRYSLNQPVTPIHEDGRSQLPKGTPDQGGLRIPAPKAPIATSPEPPRRLVRKDSLPKLVRGGGALDRISSERFASCGGHVAAAHAPAAPPRARASLLRMSATPTS